MGVGGGCDVRIKAMGLLNSLATCWGGLPGPGQPVSGEREWGRPSSQTDPRKNAGETCSPPPPLLLSWSGREQTGPGAAGGPDRQHE